MGKGIKAASTMPRVTVLGLGHQTLNWLECWLDVKLLKRAAMDTLMDKQVLSLA
jgi:hypothetical protein